MRNWLLKPYPFFFEDPGTRLRIAIFVFLFVFSFLAVFEPFDLMEVVSMNFYACCLIYAFTSAIITYSFCSIMVSLFPGFVNEKDWNIGREFIMMNLILITISVANVSVGLIIELHPRTDYPLWRCVLDDLMHTYAIGIFPVMIITFTNYTVMLKRNLSKAEQHNVKLNDREPAVILEVPTKVTLNSAANNNDIEVQLEDLLYIMADGNYVEFYLTRENEVVREIRRNTLNNIEGQLKDYDFLFRSHRTFIVNLNRITASSGNAQGYQLTLDAGDQVVPVSRRKLTEFDDLMITTKNLLEQYPA